MSTKRTRFDALSEELFPDGIEDSKKPTAAEIAQKTADERMQAALDSLTDQQKRDTIAALAKRSDDIGYTVDGLAKPVEGLTELIAETQRRISSTLGVSKELMSVDGIVGPRTIAEGVMTAPKLSQVTVYMTINGVPRWRAYKLSARSLSLSMRTPAFGGSFVFEVPREVMMVEIDFEVQGYVAYDELKNATEVALVLQHRDRDMPQAYRLRVEAVHHTMDAQNRTTSRITAKGESI